MKNVTILQEKNLQLNYTKWEATKIGEHVLSNGQKIEIILQRRDHGIAAYYAVLKLKVNGKAAPICYVVGREIRYFSDKNVNLPRKWARFEIKSLFVSQKHRRKGVALAVYSAIISSGIILISDKDRNESSLSLWSKLEQLNNVTRVIQYYQISIAFPYFSQ